jgi:hypothetical protein
MSGLPLAALFDQLINCRLCDKVPSLARAGDAGFVECGHPGVTGQRRAQQQDGDARARGFAKPHVEIEQRVEAEFAQQRAVTGFGGDVSRTGALRFVIAPLSLTRIDRLTSGWCVVAVNRRA